MGTKFGIPLSTTHCQVGATTGVALLEVGTHR
jgi:phosphate/sulfate permease